MGSLRSELHMQDLAEACLPSSRYSMFRKGVILIIFSLYNSKSSSGQHFEFSARMSLPSPKKTELLQDLTPLSEKIRITAAKKKNTPRVTRYSVLLMSLAWHVILTKEMICVVSFTCNDSKHQETLAISIKSYLREGKSAKALQ